MTGCRKATRAPSISCTSQNSGIQRRPISFANGGCGEERWREIAIERLITGKREWQARRRREDDPADCVHAAQAAATFDALSALVRSPARNRAARMSDVTTCRTRPPHATACVSKNWCN